MWQVGTRYFHCCYASVVFCFVYGVGTTSIDITTLSRPLRLQLFGSFAICALRCRAAGPLCVAADRIDTLAGRRARERCVTPAEFPFMPRYLLCFFFCHGDGMNGRHDAAVDINYGVQARFVYTSQQKHLLKRLLRPPLQMLTTQTAQTPKRHGAGNQHAQYTKGYTLSSHTHKEGEGGGRHF